ncbi:MAG: amidohydrolase family protein [candidate division WOR-3 bacterium]
MRNKNFILKNVRYYDTLRNSIVFREKIYIKDGKFSFDVDKGECKGFILFDCSNFLLFPSFVQIHTHICQNLAKGFAEEMGLYEWLQKRIIPYERKLKKDILSLSCKLSLYELIDSGTTTILDMGTFENQETVFDEIENSNIRGFSGNVFMDRKFGGFKTEVERYESYTKDLFERIKDYKNVKYVLCPRFVPGVTKEGIKTLLKLRDKYDLFIHTHSSETLQENLFTLNRYNMSNVEFFDGSGLFEGNVILAHCIFLNKNDIEILKKKKVNIAHCPSANGKLKNGIADITSFCEQKINVGLGSDGAPCNNNMNQIFEMRLAKLFQNIKYGEKGISSAKIFQMATINGAKALKLENNLGFIKDGFDADFILVEDDVNVSSFVVDPASSFMFSIYPENIKYVFSKGKPLKYNGKVLAYDKDDLLKERKKILKYLFSNRF